MWKGEGLGWAKSVSQSRALIKLKKIMSMSHFFTITIHTQVHILHV